MTTDRLVAALEALSAAVEAPSSLAELVAELERALARAFELADLRIRLGDEPAAEREWDVPLVIDGERVGTIRLPRAPEPETQVTLRLLAAPLAAAIGFRRRREERAELGRFARIDALCGIPNRLAFEEQIGAAWLRCRERRATLALALLDIDFFKAFNDRYGHVAGDRCLRSVAALFAETPAGSGMFAARYGGEEFVLLFEDSGEATAFEAACGLLEALGARGIEHAGTTLGVVSASIGISVLVPTAAVAAVDLIDEADRALYRAKTLGRNRVCVGGLASHGPVVARRVPARDDPDAVEAATFGREADLARILAALRHARLLTLVGPRGIGKSRLLALVAAAAKSQYERVVLVEAEWLRGGAHPATALAAVLDVAVGASGVLASVTDALAEQESLLLLDGVEEPSGDVRAFCEHVLRHTAGVSIVATSAAPLGLADERAVVVPPLDDEAALALLHFHGGDRCEAMRVIVRHLGGNPAAIEAAGDRVGRLGAEATLAWLEATAGTSSLR